MKFVDFMKIVKIIRYTVEYLNYCARYPSRHLTYLHLSSSFLATRQYEPSHDRTLLGMFNLTLTAEPIALVASAADF